MKLKHVALTKYTIFLYINKVLCYRLTCCIYTCIYPNTKTVGSLKHLTPYLGEKFALTEYHRATNLHLQNSVESDLIVGVSTILNAIDIVCVCL